MKIFIIVRHIAIYYFLLCLFICLLVKVKEVRGKSDLKTKLLIQNIRTHIAQKIDEIVKEKECEEGLTLCKNLKNTNQEVEEEKSEEIPPPPKIVRGQHKPTVKVSQKDVIQTRLPKVHKSFLKKPAVTEETVKHRKTYSPLEKLKSLEISIEEKVEKKATDREEKLISSTLSKPPIEERQQIKRNTKLFEPPQLSPKTEIKKNIKTKIIKSDEDKKIFSKKDFTEKQKKRAEVEKVGKDEWERKVDQKTQEKPLIFLSSSFIFALDSDTPDANLCVKQTQVYVKNLKNLKTWALMMYDASAKLPAGIFQGNINQYGDFDECLSINAVFKRHKNKTREFSSIQGKYCLVNADLESGIESENFKKALKRVKSFEFIKSTIDDPGHFIPRFSTLNWGICVPSPCLAEDVEKFFISHVQSFNESLGLLIKVKVKEENCVVKDNLKFRLQTGTAITITLYLAVLLASIYATYIDIASTKRNKNMKNTIFREDKTTQKGSGENTEEYPKNIIMAFSLNRNLKKILQDKDSKKCIECINGIKSIFTVVLYFAHKTIPLGMTPFFNRIFLTKISNEPITVFLRSSMVYTDSFLLISGVLTSYNLAREISEKKKVSWVKKSMDRFIRLTPASVAVILFYAYVWDHLGSGPIWNSVVKQNSKLCQKYLWRNILFIQNFFAFEDMCAPQTHQLALDLQLSILAPLFVHLLHNYGKAGTGILQALFLLSSLMRYVTTANNELSVIIYHGMHVSQLYKTANLLYSQTLHRASPYVLGTIVGYYLKQYEKRLRVPKVVAASGWIATLYLAYYSVISPYNLASENYHYNVKEGAQYAALSPVAWSLALSWIIAACHLGCGGKLNQFLSQKVFLIFSRISYSVYLTQFLVFFYNVSVKKSPEVFNVAGSLNITEFFAVIFFSTVVTLFFDIPTEEIKRIILNNKKYVALKQSEGDKNHGETKDPEQNLETKKEDIFQDFEKVTEDLVHDEDDFIEDKIEEKCEGTSSMLNEPCEELIKQNYAEEDDEKEDIEEGEDEENIERGDDDDDDNEEEEDEEDEEENEEEEDEEYEEENEEEKEEEENMTTFQLRLPKFSLRLNDDPEDKDWLIVEAEKEFKK